MIKSDERMKQDIEDELRWDPKVATAQVKVRVANGAVSLLGTVETYAQMWAVEDATKRVSGVRAIAQELTVRVLKEHVRNDSQIAVEAQRALTWDARDPKTVTATVEQGLVRLDGQVTWDFQRNAAERAVGNLAGVVGIFNAITLEPHSGAARVREQVKAALDRRGTADAKSIRVETFGSTVTLSGNAAHWQSIEYAANAAWKVPGVTEVVDHVQLTMTI
jgi:osmotically-inducible protein OsmY